MVRDPSVHLQVLVGVADWLTERGAAVLGVCDSGHPGPRGNVEFFIYFCDARGALAGRRTDARAAALHAVEVAHA